MSKKNQLKELHDMADLAAVDEAINKADSDWCNSLEAAWLESQEDSKRLKTKEEKVRNGACNP